MRMWQRVGWSGLAALLIWGQYAAVGSQPDALIAEYTFHEGAGSIVYDVSGVNPVMHLAISNQSGVTWVDGGLRIENRDTLLWAEDKKIYAACTLTDEITISAWVRPSCPCLTGPARVVTFSEDASLRNFTLGVDSSDWIMRLRTTQTTANGIPPLESGTVDTRVTHVVYTRHAAGDEFFYMDGVQQASGARLGSFTNWDATHVFGLGNEINPDDDRQFYGTFYRVGIYSQAMAAPEVAALYQQGHKPAMPAPVIRANGRRGGLTVAPDVPVTVSASLTAGEYAGTDVDWFVMVVPHMGGEWYYLAADMQWVGFPANAPAECRPALGGPLMNIYDPVNLLDRYRFASAGTYDFYFAVDAMDGRLNYPAGQIVYDRITVIVE